MSHISIASKKTKVARGTIVHHAKNVPQEERMEARIAELDTAHNTETKRLAKLLRIAKQKFLLLVARDNERAS